MSHSSDPALASLATARPSKSPLERRRWRWGLAFACWLLISLLSVAPLYVKSLTEGLDPFPWSRMLSELLDWYLWLLLVPPIWWIARRFPIERRCWLRRLGINLAFGPLIASLYSVLSLLKSQLITDFSIGKASASLLGHLGDYLAGGFGFFLAVYAAILATIHAVRYYWKYHDRELKASRLETQLAVAKLNALRMQLHPHFLFNTLNAISSLMHHDVDAADRMIAKLSDLLRLALDKDDRQVVPLSEELAFLDRYVAIEMIRFRDRLQVAIDVEPGCLEARVPKLILQPLVENAIRHGIAMRSAAGKIVLRGRRRGDRLRLEVVDDGPGLPAGKAGVREGVGLANTRARLAQLYGPRHRFLLRDARRGGVEVVIEVPFEREERLPTGEALAQPAA
ncbi:MAG: histidine kinase [Acidobacteria bacterium]|nr:MAG: histidine kinase [Acidobacteriota bacterium]